MSLLKARPTGICRTGKCQAILFTERSISTKTIIVKTLPRYAFSYRIYFLRTNGSILQFELVFVVIRHGDLQFVWRLPFDAVDRFQLKPVRILGGSVGYKCDRPIEDFQFTFKIAAKTSF